MKLIFSERAWEDYLHWQASDPKLLARLNVLIKECTRTPFRDRQIRTFCADRSPAGGLCRLTQEHRLVYARPTTLL